MSDDILQEIIELEAQGYRATAMRRLNEYLADNPTSAEGYYALARLLSEPQARYEALRAALEHRPDYPEAEALHAELLASHPDLQPSPATSSPWRIALGAFLLVIVVGGIGVGLWAFGPEAEPEVVVVAPDTATPPPTVPPPPPAATSTPAPSATPSPTVLPSETSAGGMIVSATPRPSPSPTPGEEASDASGPRALLLGAQYDLMRAAIDDLIPNISRAEMPPPDPAAWLGAAPGVVVGPELGVYGQARAAQAPEVLPLAAPSGAWRLTLAEPETLRGVVGYLLGRYGVTVEALGPLFANPRADLTEDDIALGFMLAYAQAAQGDDDSALALNESLAAFNPALGPYLAANRAYAIARTGDVGSAAQLYLDLAAAYPVSGFVESNIARIYADAGDLDAAALAADDAIRAAPDSPRPYLEQGRIFAAQEQPNAALQAFGVALSQEETYAPAFYERARVRLALGLLRDAEADIAQARDLAPSIAAYHALAGDIASARQDWPAAVAAYRDAEARGASEVVGALAWAEYQAGNLDAAIQAANRALSDDRDNPRAWLARGRAYMAQNELGSALNDFDQGLQRAPAEVGLLVARCEVHNRLDNPADAARDCDAALSIDPDNAAALTQRGILRHNADDRAGAAQDFAEALSLNPDTYQAHYYLGLYALQERRYQDAITALSQAIERAPQLGPAFAARGVAYRITGAWGLAIVDLEQALILLPDDQYNYYELGLAYRALADEAYEANNETSAEQLYANAANAFRLFLNASQPEDPFVLEATEGLRYANAALNVIQQGD